MPIYEFRCDHCGHQFEKLQGHKAPAPPCPRTLGGKPPTGCCGHDTAKVISRSTFHLKGEGWASDGYQ